MKYAYLKFIKHAGVLAMTTFLLSCGSKEVVTEYYENGEVKSTTEIAHGKKDGKVRQFYPGGQLKIISTFRSDTLNGPEVHYSEDGTVKLRIDYLAGVRNGPYQLFDKGVLAESGTYRHGLKSELIKQYYPNGHVHFMSYVLPFKTDQSFYWSIEYDSAGNVVNRFRDLAVTFGRDSIKLGDKINVEFQLQKKLEYDSGFIVSGGFNDFFEMVGTPDTIKLREGKASMEFIPKKRGEFYLRGNWVIYMGKITKDTIYVVKTFNFFEERYRVY